MVENAELRDQLVVLKSIPADDSSEQEVESLWRQLMIHESFSSSELAEAKAKRRAAEAARQQTESESVRNTRAATKRMRNKAESAVEEAKGLRDDAASGGAITGSGHLSQLMSNVLRTTVLEWVEPEATSRGTVILAPRGLGIWKPLNDVPPRLGGKHESDPILHKLCLRDRIRHDSLYESLVAGA